jgi:hypothetical protein
VYTRALQDAIPVGQLLRACPSTFGNGRSCADAGYTAGAPLVRESGGEAMVLSPVVAEARSVASVVHSRTSLPLQEWPLTCPACGLNPPTENTPQYCPKAPARCVLR